MCTMTWFVKDDGYELFFNRDERLSRSQAELPSVMQARSVSGQEISYVSPTDADAGGSWIAANEFGVTVCLLNHYQFEQIETYKSWTSRGEIVRQFAITQDLVIAEQQFLALELDDYRAFRMFIIEPSGQNRLFVWDGHKPRIERNVTTPKSSSSVNAKNVKSIRKQLFRDLNLADQQDTQAYLDFHSSHSPSKSKESVCMHRDDANTVSLSVVNIEANSVSFSYADGSPCEAELGAPLSIPLMSANHLAVLPVAATR